MSAETEHTSSKAGVKRQKYFLIKIRGSVISNSHRHKPFRRLQFLK